ncbi:glycerophosphodiester phosphodiesterase [Paenibacillus sp. IB182496]|uniref:Glycerophosphodiester phosphodiesterase n=1 Tax=Paenibacillus sabuli TaxID=2772509 RepID=A0A927BV42_9BACL|nr:glycerophosphodiester phosphodiesterase family protein [Paenibacillus sabuli]MBD2846024.1 glycerophosphodiester phosphodiesterase [Paenibacillus sabuli]
MMQCCAHRGASGEAPENTMAAIQRALAHPFVQWIELDVQLTADGEVVVMHDETVNRTTNGRGKVREMTLERLRRLDAGSWYGRVFKGERIPTLEEVLQATVGRCRLNIELKTYADSTAALAAKVVPMLAKHGLEHDTIVTSFDARALRLVREHSESVRTGWIVSEPPPDLTARLRDLDSTFLSLSYKHVASARLDELRAAGVEVMIWTVNSAAHLQRLAQLERDLMLCTNYPARYGLAVLHGADSTARRSAIWRPFFTRRRQ